MSSAERTDILIVDDLPERHLAYRAILDELGQNIVAVPSGERALELLLDRDFAMILLDVNMPGMSGLETAALIRRRKKSRHTPIIFVTAFADDAQTVEGYALGAVDYIMTPIVPEILRAKVKVFVQLFQTRAALTQSHSLLEQRVADRTAELERTAEHLRAEIHVRTQAEERLTVLVQELAHRVKNLLAVFQSIAARTLHGKRTLQDAREILIGRLQSLGHAHELLTDASWEGADLQDVVATELAGFSDRVRASGPPVSLSPSAVQTFALIVHELSTNAAKYGALSSSEGEVRVHWSVVGNGGGPFVEFCWKETGGPPVKPPSHDGFGMSLISTMGKGFTGRSDVEFAPEGFACRIRVPLDNISPNAHDKSMRMLARSDTLAPDAGLQRKTS